MMTANAGAWVGLRLDPLDTLFFRDGRPFEGTARVTGGLPTPQTLAGAVRTALLAQVGFRFDHFARARRTMPLHDALAQAGAPLWITQARFRGPWIALDRGKMGIEPLLPMPAVLAPSGDNWSRAWPIGPRGLRFWRDPDSLWLLTRRLRPDSKAEPGLLSFNGACKFLDGKDPQSEDYYKLSDLYDFENRVGIGIDVHSHTSAVGDLYGIRLLRLRHKVRELPLCLYAEMQPGPEPAARPWFAHTPMAFGGEGRHVRVSETRPCIWPRPLPARQRSLWYLTTPTFLPPRETSRRCLPNLAGLRAAMSEKGMAVSGWDVARNGPRATRFAVPGGAVYFVEGPAQDRDFLLSEEQSSTEDLLAEGWGFALQGKWEIKT